MRPVASHLGWTGQWARSRVRIARTVAPARHGSGVAQTLYQQLERFASDSGARWLRLGVVRGNARAERFWERCGFVEVRMRRAVAMGKRVNDLRVMAKPLAGGTLGEYLSLVPRDRPGS